MAAVGGEATMMSTTTRRTNVHGKNGMNVDSAIVEKREIKTDNRAFNPLLQKRI